ncbi:MAG TPA: porin [Chitinophagaceae bacterium]|nr:porin [Chitinophagaceae bacterium]
MNNPLRPILVGAALLLISFSGKSQFLMDMIDTTKELGKGFLSLYKKFDHVKISGYIQPQFQAIQSKGAKSFNGGDFPDNTNNRFLLRRGRLRFDYVRFNNNQPQLQFVFQFDGTERGVFIRDFWGRIYENKLQSFSGTIGMFARPFGYELNLSSSDRESPERGRMSQILLRTERDLGAMISFEPAKSGHPLRNFRWDLGVFNGQGLTSPVDYDSYKDIISRIALKPVHLSKKTLLSAAIGTLQGGWIEKDSTRFTINTINGNKTFAGIKSGANVDSKAPRKYYEADAQLKFLTKAGATELRAEYWWGTQSASASTSESPGTLLKEPVYVRQFNGAYFYLLHNIFNTHHQIGVKYDWYDPNSKISGTAIGKNNNLNSTDIKFSTLGFGYINYINENLKLVLWYEIVTNEKTSFSGFTSDVKDNVFTFRLQFRF